LHPVVSLSHSKIPAAVLDGAVKEILAAAKDPKTKRRFLESVELQIGLKNLDPSKDKRFAGSYVLPKEARPNTKVCIIGDQKHLDIAKELKIDAVSADDLKKFDKKKKPIKKWASSYDALLATDTLIKTIPRLVGPQLNRMGMFPSPISHTDDIQARITEIKSTVKFQLKKVLCLGVAVGHVNMTDSDVKAHLVLSINFLVSLLKKGWQNIRSLYIKTSMGKPVRIY
jgi:large subunit ribosomal protein L10Ae